MRRKHRIVFFGTPHEATHVLGRLMRSRKEWEVVSVVTRKSKMRGRKKIMVDSPVKQKAHLLRLPVYETESVHDIKEKIVNTRAELGILFAFGRIIPSSILALFPKGIVNVHPSLLPQYRGPTPVQSALIAGEKKTGISLIVLDDQMDHGPIVAQKETDILAYERFPELFFRLTFLGAELLIETLPLYLSGQLIPREQQHSLASFTRVLTRNDGKIHWNKHCLDIYNRYRGLFPWPGSFTFWHEKRLKIMEMFAEEKNITGEVGSVILHSSQYPAVICKDGIILLKTVQLEGKKPLSGKEFIQGSSGFLGARLV